MKNLQNILNVCWIILASFLLGGFLTVHIYAVDKEIPLSTIITAIVLLVYFSYTVVKKLNSK